MVQAISRYRAPGLIFLAAVIVAALFGCAPDADPFKVGARSWTPTPVGFVTTATSTPEKSGSADPIVGKGTIRFADDGTNYIQFGSTLAGYIMVWGYGYSAELISVKDIGYQKAVDDGLVDIVIEAPKTEAAAWYNAQIAAGKIVDAGSLYGAGSDKRIIVTAVFKDKNPELVEFLGKASLGQEAMDRLTGQITGGRTGIRANVAVLIYLKEPEATWGSWIPSAIKAEVSAAIAAGRTSLLNRACIPDGGAGAGSPNCGT